MEERLEPLYLAVVITIKEFGDSLSFMVTDRSFQGLFKSISELFECDFTYTKGTVIDASMKRIGG